MDSPWKKVLLFAFIWPMVGFSTGTSVLIGPVGWITRSLREAGVAESSENALVISVIAMYVAGSALISIALTRIVARTRERHVRLGIPLVVLVSAAGALWLWLTPEVMGSNMREERRPGSSFTFGPYPTEQRLAALKRQGYTAVISLLHPAVVPFEPKLIADETAAAERVGIELIHLPMLPWIADNTAALNRIEALAREGGGPYYVHCYLGKDRVRLLQRVVEDAEGTVEIEAVSRDKDRTLENGQRFERGEIVALSEDLFVTPLPTDEELQTFVVRGPYRRVVSLLDPDNPEQLPWIEREKTLLEGNRIEYVPVPLPVRGFNPQRALEIAEVIDERSQPTIVHEYLSPTSGRSPAAEADIQAHRSGLPPLPPSLFVEPMSDGTAAVVAPNVAIGPRPAPNEFGAYLFPRGVRGVVFL
ncbi:MAG: hypothetical protein R3344_12855, partial [Acidobacteriota bacterium]|nr:hypothetical protein [Acidobacteriota bacterium]